MTAIPIFTMQSNGYFDLSSNELGFRMSETDYMTPQNLIDLGVILNSVEVDEDGIVEFLNGIISPLLRLSDEVSFTNLTKQTLDSLVAILPNWTYQGLGLVIGNPFLPYINFQAPVTCANINSTVVQTSSIVNTFVENGTFTILNYTGAGEYEAKVKILLAGSVNVIMIKLVNFIGNLRLNYSTVLTTFPVITTAGTVNIADYAPFSNLTFFEAQIGSLKSGTIVIHAFTS